MSLLKSGSKFIERSEDRASLICEQRSTLHRRALASIKLNGDRVEDPIGVGRPICTRSDIVPLCNLDRYHPWEPFFC